MTFVLKVEVSIRAFALGTIDGHGAGSPLMLCACLKASKSSGATRTERRFVPRPTLMVLMSPTLMCSRSVRSPMPSRAAASLIVSHRSGSGDRGGRLRRFSGTLAVSRPDSAPKPGQAPENRWPGPVPDVVRCQCIWHCQSPACVRMGRPMIGDDVVTERALTIGRRGRKILAVSGSVPILTNPFSLSPSLLFLPVLIPQAKQGGRCRRGRHGGRRR